MNLLLLALWPVSALGTYLLSRRDGELLASKLGATYTAYAGRTWGPVPRFAAAA